MSDRDTKHVHPLDDFGKLVLRCSVAGLMLFHGAAKLTDGIGSIEQMLTGADLPVALAYGVYIGELVAPVLMIIGLWTRLAAIVFVINMVMAIFLGHSNDILALNQFGGWAIELQMLYLLGAFAVVLLGPGRIAVPPRSGWLA
jgi:putative oxidoreductase